MLELKEKKITLTQGNNDENAVEDLRKIAVELTKKYPPDVPVEIGYKCDINRRLECEEYFPDPDIDFEYEGLAYSHILDETVCEFEKLAETLSKKDLAVFCRKLKELNDCHLDQDKKARLFLYMGIEYMGQMEQCSDCSGKYSCPNEE